MRYIEKSKEPKKLTDYKKTEFATFTNFSRKDGKDVVQESLLKEQGFICAYCMRRIEMDTIRIEHINSQSDFPEYQLDYDNMIGVCHGTFDFDDEKHPDYKKRYCEQNRGNQKLLISPLKINLVNTIFFTSDGSIYSNDSVINDELDNIKKLNLNIQTLKDNRIKVWEGVQEILNIKAKKKLSIKNTTTKDWQLKDIENIYKKYNTKSIEGLKFNEYCEIVNYFIKKILVL